MPADRWSRTARGRWAIGLVCCLLPLLCGRTAGSASAPPGAGAEAGEAVLVRRVHWPVMVEPSRGHRSGKVDCSRLVPSDVELREDGIPLPPVAIGPKPQPRVHAILIDTSRSMRGKLDQARAAASAYVAALPADEPAMLATFDDVLILRAQLTTDRGRLKEKIRRLEPGIETALWDALYYVVRYLSAVRSEKVVILITDGEDSASSDAHAFDRAVALARTVPDLTIFPLGLGLRPSASHGFPPLGDQLRELATETGGAFFEPDRPSRLQHVFEVIRKRMDMRLYVSYVPLPFGEGPADGEGDGSFHWRKVTVKARSGLACRVTSIGPPRRLERGRGGRDPAPRYPDSPPTVPVSGSGRTLVGRTVDVARERGILLKRTRDGRAHRAWRSKEARFVERDYVVEAPPIDRLRSELSGPVDVLAYMLEHEATVDGRALEPPHVRSPWLVHGQTFLELRELVGRALFRTYPDYATWTRARAEAAVDSRLQAVLRAVPASDELTPDRLHGLKRSLMARETDPATGSQPDFLAQWLADVAARDVVRQLERRVLDAMLDPRRALADWARTGRAAQDSWERLGRWFRPATDVRIVAPLVPVLDPERDVVGFFRFVLPRADEHGGVSGVLPARPLAILALDALLERAEIAELLPGQARVVAVTYGSVDKREARRLPCPEVDRTERRGLEEVVLRVEKLSGSDTFELRAYFDPADEQDRSGVPRCLWVAGDRGDGLGAKLARLLGNPARPTPSAP